MRNKPKTEQKKGSPSWLVSFADMITLLLSFFIMLQAFAKVRDQELFNRGRGGFLRAIAGLGIPDWLLGHPEGSGQKDQARVDPIEEDPDAENPDKVLDADDEKIRKLFQELGRLRRAEVGDQWGSPAQWLATPIRFAPSEIRLQDAGKEFLEGFARDLRQYSGSGAPRVSVIGLAPDAPSPKDRWMLSARRAKAVEAFLATVLPRELMTRGIEIESWGGGSGEHWYGAAPQQPQQAFVVLGLMQSQGKE